MLSATFELFEFICKELQGRDNCFITNEDLGSETEEQTGQKVDHILDNLRIEHETSENQMALGAALQKLEEHFAFRHSELPFTYELNTRQFRTRDQEFVNFVAEVSGRRSSGAHFAKEFENAACGRLQKKVTGVLHNVGAPRQSVIKAKPYKHYLMSLGFDDRVVLGKEKDAGLDIIWFPPLGANPVAPVVSLQCKNGLFSRSVAREASARTAETLLCHRMLRGGGVHLTAIVFNDYIEPDRLPNKPLTYVPLGLSDLAGVKDTQVVSL